VAFLGKEERKPLSLVAVIPIDKQRDRQMYISLDEKWETFIDAANIPYSGPKKKNT
jgi:hypothetical protein